MKLYNYYRSSSSYRVRIALGLKNIPYEYAPVHLLKGEQFKPEYLTINPQGLVPALIDGNNTLTQSLAIIEYLEETHPEPALLPKSPIDRAWVRSLALHISCEIHPLQTPRITKYLKNNFNISDEQKKKWIEQWISVGLEAFEKRLKSNSTGLFCFGDKPTVADICLIPQVFAAKRFEVDLANYPAIMAIYNHCMTLPAFALAAPEKQKDAENP